MIKGFGGATLWSEDLNNLLPFYRDTLGLEPGRGMDGFIAFDGGQGGSASFNLGTHSEVHGPNKDPMRHMVAFVTDDMAGTVAELKAKGVQFLSEPAKFDTVTVSTFSDPEGNLVQLLQWD